MRVAAAFLVVLGLFASSFATAVAQRPGAFGGARDYPAINYTAGPVNDVVARLNLALASGAATLAFDESRGGYLGGVLDALQISVSSQMLAFAETSLQASQIRRENPRAVYYNDVVSVAWIRGSDLLELAAQDPQQGVVLYTLGADAPAPHPGSRATTPVWPAICRGTRWPCPGTSCRRCSPGPTICEYADGGFVDHRLPVAERWGGWFVTGRQVPARHMGNQPTMQPKRRTGPRRSWPRARRD